MLRNLNVYIYGIGDVISRGRIHQSRKNRHTGNRDGGYDAEFDERPAGAGCWVFW